MAQQVNGYQKLQSNQYDSYEHWRSFCLTHGVNVDWSFGNQCVDTPALLWFQYNLWLKTGPVGYAYEIWTYSKDVNARSPFIAVGGNAPAMTRKTMIKRGDCIVFAPSGLNYTGHVCFADEDYNGTDYLWCLGQNQGQGIGWGVPSNTIRLNLSSFLGAFRNTNWEHIDPTPPTPSSDKKKEFPWVLYARKFRTNRR